MSEDNKEVSIAKELASKVVPKAVVSIFDVIRERFSGSIGGEKNLPSAAPLKGKWRSTWQEGRKRRTEIINVVKTQKHRVYGQITSDENLHTCDFEGIYTGRFLILIWLPSADVKRPIEDHGCYFLEKQAGGSFSGWATGFYHDLGRNGRVDSFPHQIEKL